ncbi:MAG: UDP-3-O-acyl-N-acetylglucosamine deacetylase [Xanthobacteraceae bacterium]
MRAGRQTTLRSSATLSGIGVHSGAPATVALYPAEPNTGIVFVRTGADGCPQKELRADVRSVCATEFATVLGDRDGPVCATAEHVLAALFGLGVDNAVIEIDGPEVPIMDGSAEEYVEAIDRAGIVFTSAARRYLKVLKPVAVTSGRSRGELRPYSFGFRVETEIEFAHPQIGRQTIAFDLDPTTFRRDVARARTFGFMSDVSKLWSAGYALGACFENTVVLAEDRVLNPEGLRFGDEFVRHKALDAIGDLSLAGLPLLGAYRSICGGHKLNHAVISALIADRSAWALVEAGDTQTARGQADLPAAYPAPAFGPAVN